MAGTPTYYVVKRKRKTKNKKNKIDKTKKTDFLFSELSCVSSRVEKEGKMSNITTAHVISKARSIIIKTTGIGI